MATATANGKRQTLSVIEAAEILGINKHLAYQMVRERKNPVIRLGGRYLIPRPALNRFLAGEWKEEKGNER